MSRITLTHHGSTFATEVAVSSHDSTRIVADLLIGRGSQAILVIPGFWRSRRHPLMVHIAAKLHQTGLTVCTVDNRGHGDSGGTFEFNVSESDDVISVLEDMSGRRIIEGGVCVLAFSAGGSIALSAAARRPELIRGLVLVSPVADFKRVLPRPNPFKLNRQFSLYSVVRPPRFRWNERERRDALVDARRVTAPVCLIHSRNDWLVHHSHSEKIALNLDCQPELHILDLDRAHAERVFESNLGPWEIITRFMTEALGMNLSGT